MPEAHCFTSASFDCLDGARVLAKTVRRFHPDWKLWLCLLDREPVGFSFDPAAEPYDAVVRIEDLEIPNLDAWMFKHELMGMRAAVKGHMLVHLLKHGAENVIYFDPDVAVFHDLSEIVQLLSLHSVVATPRPREAEEGEIVVGGELVGSNGGPCDLSFVALSGRAGWRRLWCW